MPTSATRRATRPDPPRLALSIQHDARAGEPPADRAQLRRWVLGALERDAVLTLRLVGAREARALNARYRGRDYATNVLTFTYGATAGEPLQADIVICLPVVAREARTLRRTPREHFGHLVVHGVLHAQGMDHVDDDEAAAMQARETAVLRRFRIDDPYR